MNMPTFPKAFENHDFLDSQRHYIQKETHLFDIKVRPSSSKKNEWTGTTNQQVEIINST